MKKCLIFIFLIFSIGGVQICHSDTPPSSLNYQGVLRDSGGNPLNSTVDMVFRFYDEWEMILWEEAYNDTYPPKVTVTDGLFNVVLGDLAHRTPNSLNTELSSVFMMPPISLGIQVGTDPEMTPRIEVASSAYAFNADTLDGNDSTMFPKLWTANVFQYPAASPITIKPLASPGGDTILFDLQSSGGASLFSADSEGDVIGTSFTGSGAGLTGVNADMVDGFHAADLGGGLWSDQGAYINPNTATNVVITDTGSVGFNDTTPDALFHIHLLSTEEPFLISQGTGYTRLKVDTDGKVGIRRSPTYQLDVHASPATGLFRTTYDGGTGLMVNSNGRVGIGHTNPLSRLDLWHGAGDDFFSVRNSSGYQFIIENDGDVGIGTSSPQYLLDVYGTVNATEFRGDGSHLTGISAGLWQDQGSYINASNATEVVVTDTGNVGIGATSPLARLNIEEAGATDLMRLRQGGQTKFYVQNSGEVGINWTNPDASLGINANAGDNETIFRLAYMFGTKFIVKNTGYVGINASSPAYDLDVGGYIRATGGYICSGADLAEKLPVHPDYQLSQKEIEERVSRMDPDGESISRIISNGEISRLEPGTVVCITGDGLIPCSKVDDTRLAGILSTKPGIKLGHEIHGQYVALSGTVPCKVTGTIEPGDLLTTSPVPGHAQMAESPLYGSVIGKALESFSGERGTIMVWVGGL